MTQIGLAVYDIAAITKQLLGYVPPHVDNMPPDFGLENNYHVSGKYVRKQSTLKGSPLYGIDNIGREVFCPVKIMAGGTTYEFPYMVIGLKSKMILKETPMVERGGSVIEEIGRGAWEISCKGFLINHENEFPDDLLDELNSLYTYGKPISIQCALTDLFLAASDFVVMTDLEIPPKPKVIGVRDFAFTLIQDSILDLYKV